MLVISLSNCPPSLRGDLTKWLFEISTNVFVGRTSARVKDEMWNRIVRSCKCGRAVMVFGTNNEQRFDFRVHNGEWEPVDLDGLKVMLRPLPENQLFVESKFGYSKASKYRNSSRMHSSIQQGSKEKLVFIVTETTGPDPKVDRLSAIGSVIVNEECVADTFLWESSYAIYDESHDGCGQIVIKDFLEFLKNNTVIFEDKNRSLSFIEAECRRYGIKMDINNSLSLKSIVKEHLYNLEKHDLKSLQEYYGLQTDKEDLMSKCITLSKIYYRIMSNK